MSNYFNMLFLEKPKLICYDWDNTLVNTNPVCLNSLNALFVDYGMPQITIEDVVRINGYVFEEYFASLFGANKLTEVQNKYRILYENNSNLLAPLPSAIKTLEYVASCGIPQIIISNKHADLVKQEVKRFGMEKYFQIIVGPDEAGCAKPNLKMFHYALSKINIDIESQIPNNLWFCGDSTIDLFFARNINAMLLFFNQIPIEFKNNYRLEVLTHDHFLENYKIIVS